MKKYLIIIIISLFIGFLFSYYVIKEYDDAVLPTFLNGKTVYLVQQGIYSNYDNMINNTKAIDNYIYEVKNELYYVYVGMSLSKDNAMKIQNIYEFETTIATITLNNEFIKTIEQYDSLLSETNDKDAIKEICKQLLSKYKSV